MDASSRNLGKKFLALCICQLLYDRLHSPHVLLGYERTRQLASAAAGKDVVGGKGKDATYVNLYLTIEPPLKVRKYPLVYRHARKGDG